MMKKTITKNITFLHLTKIDGNSLGSIVDFVKSQPTHDGGKYQGGRGMLIDSIKYELNIDDATPVRIHIGINNQGSVMFQTIELNKYYYFRGGEEYFPEMISLADVRNRMGSVVTLVEFIKICEDITPELLNKAQESINAICNDTVFKEIV